MCNFIRNFRKRKIWPEGRPDYLHFTMSKENKDSHYALSLMAKFLGYVFPGAFIVLSGNASIFRGLREIFEKYFLVIATKIKLLDVNCNETRIDAFISLFHEILPTYLGKLVLEVNFRDMLSPPSDSVSMNRKC